MTIDTELQGRLAAVERVRKALGELFGAERRLHGARTHEAARYDRFASYAP